MPLRSINHLKKRFETSVRYKKPLWINENDIDALNALIEFVNGKPKNTHLEDALMMFYILQYWRVENENNKVLKMKETGHGIFQLTGADVLLQQLTLRINPKKEMIKLIRDEIRIHQALNGIPKEQRVKTKTVEQIIDEVLELAKNHFPLIKDLDKCEVRYIYDEKDRTISN